jgi:hypothetical protein
MNPNRALGTTEQTKWHESASARLEPRPVHESRMQSGAQVTALQALARALGVSELREAFGVRASLAPLFEPDSASPGTSPGRRAFTIPVFARFARFAVAPRFV